MKEKLDKDFNPIWLCKAGGLLFPSLYLIVAGARTVMHRGSPADWASVVLSSLLVLAFWFRYHAGKVAGLAEEFWFGMFLAAGPMCVMVFSISPENQRREWWFVSIYGFVFISVVIRYVRRFYLRPRRNAKNTPDMGPIQKANC